MTASAWICSAWRRGEREEPRAEITTRCCLSTARTGGLIMEGFQFMKPKWKAANYCSANSTRKQCEADLMRFSLSAESLLSGSYVRCCSRATDFTQDWFVALIGHKPRKDNGIMSFSIRYSSKMQTPKMLSREQGFCNEAGPPRQLNA